MANASPLRVAARFCGPPTSANGGYICGLVADAIGQLVTVRLLKPPPLDTDMTLHVDEGGWHVEHAEMRIVEARPANLDDVTPPAPPSYATAMEASRHAPWSDPAQHPCPGCFVCGPERSAGDGMRLFAGPVPEQSYVATGWVPDASMAGADGTVAAQFIAAALDCPGFQSMQTGLKPYLLGEFTCRIDQPVQAGEPCVIVGWKIEVKGRRHIVGTSLHGKDGRLCAVAKGVWIEPRDPAAA
jgi:acyl-coenzyme A thioesterase PaaI-like protein